MAKIIVVLPDNRGLNGSLRIIDDNGRTIKGPFVVKGRAADNIARDHKNPLRDRLRNYGDTPLGTYKAGPKILPTGKGTRRSSVRSYGPNGAIWLIPSGGEALQAAKTFTRESLLIHGGDLYENTPIGKKNHYVGLRPTGGCLRVSNDDMRQIVDAVMLLEAFGDPVGECTVRTGIEVSVTEVPSPQNVEPNEIKIIRDPPDTSGPFELPNPYLPNRPPPLPPGPGRTSPPPRWQPSGERTPQSAGGAPAPTQPPGRITPGPIPQRPPTPGAQSPPQPPQPLPQPLPPPTPPPRPAPRPPPGVHPTRPILGLLPTSPRAIAIEDGSAGMKKAVDWDVDVKKGLERNR